MKNKIYYYLKKCSPSNLYPFIKWKIYLPLRDTLIEKKTELEFNALFKNKNPIKRWVENNNPRKLIISLTSYPKRLSKLHLAIYSLLRQTIRPNKVILVLSKKEVKNEAGIPSKVLFLKKFGLEIKFVKENYRAYKKLIYTIKDFPQYSIVTVDDDIIYPKWFLEKIYQKHKEYPNDIICYRAHLIKKDNNKLRPYIEWESYDLKKFSDGMNLFPTGVCGVLYPPNSLNKEVFNSKIFLKICPSNDDIWFKAMGLLNKKNYHRVFRNKNPHFASLGGTQETSLMKENVSTGKNDEQIKNVFKMYNLNKYITPIK